MLLQTVIGNENWQSGGTKLHLFVCPTRAFPLNAKEDHLWMVARGASRHDNSFPTISQIGSPRVISAGQGMNSEIVGKWTTAVYDIPDNVLMKCMIMRSSPQGNQASNILIRTRQGAALRRISVTTIPNPRSAMDRLVIEGQFDIVDLKQAAEMGFTPPQMYMPSYLATRWARLPYIDVRELAPETVTAPVVVRQRIRNTSGETVEIASSHKRRALDL